MKKALFILMMLLLVMLLAGCAANNNTFPEADANYQRDPMDTSTPSPAPHLDPLPENYDPASEENDFSDDPAGVYYDEYGRQPYAGATPILLDPVNLPTPTPRVPLTFTYTQASVNGLTFEYPVGWSLETPDKNTIVLRDPYSYDNYTAEMTIRFESVPGSYTLKDVKNKVAEMLKEIGQYNFTKWETKIAAERKLLNKDGWYNNYSGVYFDGTKISGRVMVSLLDDNRIITLHMTCPDGYNNSYMNVVKQFSNTAKLN